MAYIKSDIQIKINNDGSYIILINKNCFEGKESKDYDYEDNDLTYTASDLKTLITKLEEKLPLLKPRKSDFDEGFSMIED